MANAFLISQVKKLKSCELHELFLRGTVCFFGLNKGEGQALCTVKKLRSTLLYSMSPSDYNVS